jgi:hypothetical protein
LTALPWVSRRRRSNAPFGPIKRKDLIHYLKELGFDGPYVGGKPQYMVKGEIKLTVPNPHQSDIDRSEWEKL